MNKIDKDFFETMYRHDKDPWKFGSSQYERDRYKKIIEIISYKRYQLIFEPGCSIGVLSERLASVANQVDSFDISPTAIKLAKMRCSHLTNVSFQCASLLEKTPHFHTDLLLLSEVGYYFQATALRKILLRLVAGTSPQAMILAVHWLGHSSDHVLHGDEVHTIIDSIPNLNKTHEEKNKNFRLDLWRKQ